MAITGHKPTLGVIVMEKPISILESWWKVEYHRTVREGDIYRGTSHREVGCKAGMDDFSKSFYNKLRARKEGKLGT